MTDRYAIATVQGPNPSKGVNSFAKSQGQPSPTDGYVRRVRTVYQGHWRAGVATDLITQSAYFVEKDGILGDPIAIEDATFTNATRRIALPTGTLTGMTFHASWHVWISTTDGGWTPGVYPVSAKIDDQTLELAAGPAVPADNVLTNGYLLLGEMAEPYCALGSLNGADNNNNFAVLSHTNLDQSPWHDYGPYVMPGTLVNGGKIECEWNGRIRIRNIAGRPFSDSDGDGIYDVLDEVRVYFTVDPWSGALTQTSNAASIASGPSPLDLNEFQYYPPRPVRLGWTPSVNYTAATFEKFTVTGATTDAANDRITSASFTSTIPQVGSRIQITAAGTSGLALATDYFVITRPASTTVEISATRGGSILPLSDSTADVGLEVLDLRVVYTTHGLFNGEVVHLCTTDHSNANNINPTTGEDLGPPSTVTEGQGYFVQAKTSGKFYLSHDIGGSLPLDYIDDASSDLIVSQPVLSGSRHSLRFVFKFVAADETDDFVACKLKLEGVADGRTAEDEQGVMWTATLTIWPNSSYVGKTSDKRIPLTKNGVLVWGGGYQMTTPGNTMSEDAVQTTQMNAAPLYFARKYFTPSDTVTFTACSATDVGDTLQHDYFVGLKKGDTVTITAAGGTSIALAAYKVHSKPNASNPDVIKLSNDEGVSVYMFTSNSTTVEGTMIPSYGAFFSGFWDWGGNYDIVHVDSQVYTEGTAVEGPTDYPITPTFQGTEVVGYSTSTKNSQGYRRATVTEVWRSAVAIGEVCYHDNLRRVMFVRPYGDGEHVRYGDALTLKTFRNTRAGGTANTFTWEATEIQSKTTNALLVKMGPNGTRLSQRIAMSGPQSGDCELNIRTGIHESVEVRGR